MQEQPIIDSVPNTAAQEQQVDTLYQQGLLDFQNGRWDKALAAFEEVLRLQPDHAAARAFLDETRIKASLEESRPKPKRARFGGRLKYVALVLAAAVLLVGAVLAVRYAYNNWVVPREGQAQQVQERAKLEARAYQFLANRDAGQFDGYPDPQAMMGAVLDGPRPRGRVVATHLGTGLADVVFGAAILAEAERLGLGTLLGRS